MYFGVLGGIYGVSFLLPQFGFAPMTTSWVTAIPFTAGAVACVLWSRHSEVYNERKIHLMISLAVGAGGLIAFASMPTVPLKLLALTVGAGIYSTMPAYLAMPPAFLPSSAAAGAIAMTVNHSCKLEQNPAQGPRLSPAE